MTKLLTEKTNAPRATTPQRTISIRLSAKDHREATEAARLSHETLPEWISSMIHTSLQP